MPGTLELEVDRDSARTSDSALERLAIDKDLAGRGLGAQARARLVTPTIVVESSRASKPVAPIVA